MKRIMRVGCSAVVAALLVVTSPPAHAQSDPDPERFAEEIAAFANWDSKNYAPSQATLFVGSSSVRFWPTAERFPGLPLVNRGFGGAHLSDVNHHVEVTVLKYRPSVVVLYAGDNDIAAGKDRHDVFEDFETFVELVRASVPGTRIVWLPIKPSLARWELWPEMMATNDLVREMTERHPDLYYADVATPMLGQDGEPMAELFVGDGLHMTPAGYDIWTEVLQSTLARIH